ncbi:MAG: chromate transporter [Rikenellaceae bacterium]|nr:chromate transporter [Rikenellaceae bacterium]
MIYLQLFLSYLKIGFFGFGGGYAMLSLIQQEVVVSRGWITAAQFTDIVAISQMTPGPIAINSATYIGYEVAGIWGSIIATTAVCVPCFVVMLSLAKFYLRVRGNRYMEGAMNGMKPVLVGMITAAALLLMFPGDSDSASFIDVWSWVIFGVCLMLNILKVNPILIIVLSAIVGVAIYA